MKVLDTNIILRLLLEDDRSQTEAVYRFLRKALADKEALLVSEAIVMEAIWVMESKDIPRPLIVRNFQKLTQDARLFIERRDRILSSLSHYQIHKVDFVDAYLAVLAQEGDGEVISFDRDFDRLPVRRVEPE